MMIRVVLIPISGGGCVLEINFIILRLHICALIRVANSGGSYVYDIQVKTNVGEIYTIVEGILTITKDITQRTS